MYETDGEEHQQSKRVNKNRSREEESDERVEIDETDVRDRIE